MCRLPRPQHNPHNQLPTSPRFPINETLEILIVQRHGQGHRLVRLELQAIIVAHQDARGVHLLVVHLKDAGQMPGCREGAPQSLRDRMLDVGPVSVALGVLVGGGAFAGGVGGRVQVPDMVPEAARWRRPENMCAGPDKRHANPAQRDAAVEIGEDDVGSAFGGLLRVGRGGLDPCHRRFLLELESHGALAVDDLEVIVRGEWDRSAHGYGTRVHVFQLCANVQSTQVQRRRLSETELRGIVHLTLVRARDFWVHGDAVRPCRFFDLLHVRN